MTFRVARRTGRVARWLPLSRKPKPAPAPESPDVAKLAEVVEGLTHQVQQLALILDEVREDLVWAVRNDKFHAAGHSQQFVERTLAVPSAEKPGDEQDESPPPSNREPHSVHSRSLFD